MGNFPPGFRPVWSQEDTGSKSVTLAAGALTSQEVCRIQTKNALQFYLTFVGNNVAAGLGTYITWRIKVDGAVLYPFTDTTGQWAAPEQITNELSPYIALPQNSLVIVECDASAGNPGGLVTARLRGSYGMIGG